MNKLIKKIKYNILYKKIEYPLLQVVKEKEYDFFNTKERLFEQKDIATDNNLILTNKKYNTIILEELNYFPLELLKLLNDNSILYFFTNKTAQLSHELSKYFKFINISTFNINLEIIPQESKDLVEFSLSNSNSINLIIANNFEQLKINHSSLLSMSYLNTYLEKNFIEKNKYIKETKKRELIKNKFIKFKNRENILLQKQKFIKSVINDLSIKVLKNQDIIKKNNIKLIKYENYIHFLIKLFNTKEDISSLGEINNLDKLVKTNIDLINNYVKLNREIQENKSNAKRDSLRIIIQKSSKNLDKIEKLYEENNDLIEQNNLYVSEISHLKFDIDEVNEKNKELITIVKELEIQLKDFESKKDIEFTNTLKKIKKENERKLLQLLEKNKKISNDFENLSKKIEKLGEKNIKNLSLLDEKGVLIQKLKLKIDEFRKENTLKEELLNKKNLIIREHENRIAILEDELKNKDLLLLNLKQELNENNKKINSTYHKELYDNLQKKYNKLKNKNKEVIDINQDYKKEIEEYEMKIQELIGYNERITKNIDIDLDDFESF